MKNRFIGCSKCIPNAVDATSIDPIPTTHEMKNEGYL